MNKLVFVDGMLERTTDRTYSMLGFATKTMVISWTLILNFVSKEILVPHYFLRVRLETFEGEVSTQECTLILTNNQFALTSPSLRVKDSLG